MQELTRHCNTDIREIWPPEHFAVALFFNFFFIVCIWGLSATLNQAVTPLPCGLNNIYVFLYNCHI